MTRRDRFGWAEIDYQGCWWAVCQLRSDRQRCGPFASDVAALQQIQSCDAPCRLAQRRPTDALEAADRNAREVR